MNKQINLFLFDDGIRKKLSFISAFTEITFPEAMSKGYLTVRIFKVLLCLSEGKYFDFILAHLFCTFPYFQNLVHSSFEVNTEKNN